MRKTGPKIRHEPSRAFGHNASVIAEQKKTPRNLGAFFWQIDCRSDRLFARCALALVLFQVTLAQADALRRDFHQLVVGKELTGVNAF